MTLLMYRGEQKTRFSNLMALAGTPDAQELVFLAMQFGFEEGAQAALLDSGRPIVDMLAVESVFVEAEVV